MLEELKKYENLGTPGYFWEFFNQFEKEDLWTEANISSYFYNKIVDGESIFDGCIPLLKHSNIISINEETMEIEVDLAYRNILYSEQFCRDRLLEWFLSSLHQDQEFYKIFSSEHTSRDFVVNAVQIDRSAFGLDYINIMNLLLSFDFLKPHPSFPQKKFIVNAWWKKFFDRFLAPEIRKRQVSLEDLKQRQEQQQIDGEKAEKYVLDFEINRLNNKEWIEWVAPYDTSLWYDILSYKHKDSFENDRFIEVKSFVWDPRFYRSKNEISKADKYWEKYCLYLIDRSKIDQDNYEPTIIINPYSEVFESNEWDREAMTYLFWK